MVMSAHPATREGIGYKFRGALLFRVPFFNQMTGAWIYIPLEKMT
jgi:hypothetical protein